MPTETFSNTITINEQNYDHMEVMVRTGTFYVDVENEWAGDTESGFGRTCHVSFDADEAKRLRDFLTDWLAREIEGERQIHPEYRSLAAPGR